MKKATRLVCIVALAIVAAGPKGDGACKYVIGVIDKYEKLKRS
jgi:hypothetical protein